MDNHTHISKLNDKDFSRRRDDRNSIDIVTIKMGDCYVTDKNETISTTLGSCIAVCIRDRTSGIGGMNHFLLPTHSAKESQQWENTSVSAATRYGSYAMEHLINSILSKGGKRNFLEFKLFGGGNITGSFTFIGKRNVEFIREYMDAEGYGIAAESLGGSHPIILNYNPYTGIAKVKRLASKATQIANIEKTFMQQLEENRIEGDIELFNGQ